MSFVHLHNHSEYSMLDGLAKVKKMAKHAVEQNMPAIAITDHGVMHGVIEFSDACADAGVKPIIGMEAYLTKRGRRMSDRDNNFDRSPHHLLLLAMNQTGYKNLMRLATLSQLEGFYYKPRVDHDALRDNAEGIICTSGCPSAEIPRLILEGKDDEARKITQWYLDTFKDRFYFEIQEHALPEFKQVNERVIAWACEFGVPVIATNDAHYVKQADAIPHDLMLCIQTTSLFTDPKRMKFNDDSYYLRSEDEMRALFDPICPEAITNTVELANRCDVKLKDKAFHLPHFKRPVRFADDSDYMRYLCEVGFEVRYGVPAREDGTDFVWVHEQMPPLPEDGFLKESRVTSHESSGLAVVRRSLPIVYSGEDKPIKLTALSPLALPGADTHPAMTPRRLRERLKFEIDTINQMGFATYMLIVWDLIRFCREANIWWDVRGSAAGSMVSHVLMLTNVEPVSNDLYFERFLNPERVTMPDIDMDFPDDQRYKLVDYTIDKYGADKVAQIITFGTMAARGSLKDIGRVLDIPLGEVSRVTQLVPAIPGKPITLKEALEQVPDLKRIYDTEAHLKELYDKAMLVEGAVRNAGTHAAGIVIADKPLIEYAPLHRLTGTPITERLNAVTQFEMNHLESIGLLKMDYLGLSMLTIIRKACELIEQRHGIKYTLDNIPVHEKATYDTLSKGDVVGIFQVEGQGMRNLMIDMKPTRFENIVAAISLFRPGPMEYIPSYIKRLHGEEPVKYHHPDLEPIFGETYGICVSGDAMLFDPITGKRHRMDEVGALKELHLQGVNDGDLSPAVGRVTHWVHNGRKPVFKLRLANGAEIKVTAEHKLLTEVGWTRLCDLKPGDYVATPKKLMGASCSFDRARLRVLGYLLADGDIGNLAAVNFISKEPALIAEYERCVKFFDNIRTVSIQQIRNVTRVSVAKDVSPIYHQPNSLLAWLRELGLKRARGGCTSDQKFVPNFVFGLNEEDIRFFLASLWDCDGYVSRNLCHYKTISERLARDVQTLLLRLGIRSVIYTSGYTTTSGKARTAYQVTLYNTRLFAALVQPMMVHGGKRAVVCDAVDSPTVARDMFVRELDTAAPMPRRRLMADYGMDRQHFMAKGLARPRIGVGVVEGVASALNLTATLRSSNVCWEEIESIDPAGEEDVFDLTVEGFHNFVANNIIVHNCVYQEQIMRVARDFAGYSMGEADTIRKAVSKKVKEQLDKHKSKFRAGAEKKGYPGEVADQIWADIEFFARYGFNKSHAAIYASITCQTAWLKATYPLEYFCALLTVESGNTDKITGLIGDAKQHGIKILPPSVNASVEDFSIQTPPPTPPLKAERPRSEAEGRRGETEGSLRFGLMAIKNVGSGPVGSIIEARNKGGPFKSLDDFARRVEMNTINKRAFESLIKVGAFDAFGTRPQLLAVVDQMIGAATTARRAAERGQGMLFGGLNMESGDDAELITLPKNVKDIPKKQQLQEEKELIGTYVSEHPLQATLDVLQDQVTHSSATLGPADNGQKVRVAGVISFIRPHTTKTGKAMAFGEMEDLFGRIELTIFPRTWDEYQGLLIKDQAVLISGKAEVPDGGAAKILVERVSTSFEHARSADGDRTREYYRANANDEGGWGNLEEDNISAYFNSLGDAPLVPPARAPEPDLTALDEKSFIDDGEGQPLPAEGSIEADPAFAKPNATDLSAFDDVSFSDADSDNDNDNNDEVEIGTAVTAIETRYAAEVSYVVAPQLQAAVREPTTHYSVTQLPVTNLHPNAQGLPPILTREPLNVVLHRNGDARSDVAKLEAALQTLRKYEGDQAFTVTLTNGGGKAMTLDFPNDTTRDCAELRAELTALLGAKCVS